MSLKYEPASEPIQVRQAMLELEEISADDEDEEEDEEDVLIDHPSTRQGERNTTRTMGGSRVVHLSGTLTSSPCG